MFNLKNSLLSVNIKHIGAELCSIKSTKSNQEFIWQADPTIWGSHAPNLFPVIGSMKDDTYYYKGKSYSMPKHGFVRHNTQFKLIKHTNNEITFKLNSTPELLEIYPFNFEFYITYSLKENILNVNHIIKNTDSTNMYFSIGGHPAFNCSLSENDNYENYMLEFEEKEDCSSYILNMDTGLVTSKTKEVFLEGQIIQLKPNLFVEDALIFKDFKSRKVILKHKNTGPILSLKFDDFNYLGIWAKPDAPYVCIEPWLGIADNELTNQQLAEKEGIIMLEGNGEFKASYAIEIEKVHLV